MIELSLASGIALPLALALLLSLWPIDDERRVARLSLGAAGLSVAASALAIAVWLWGGARPIHTAPHVLFAHGDYRFTFELVLDGAAAVFLVLVQFMTGLVMRYSRFYLHREPGFQRFFATVLMFQAAMCLLTLAGNLDLMFAGWEMVGLSSFLLIAFYRERQSAVRSALKTYSVYRIADIGMLLAACLETSGEHRWLGLLILLAAVGKSAQFPFSFWVSRAMEGPTPSSALFYGALSVHAGAYLLLRTYPLWGGVLAVRICIGAVGLLTAIFCSMSSRVQPTIKAQIGYASVTQVGLIFVEIALGLTHLALAHVVCNALLRCYQLLVSPSVVAHRLRQQATAGAARAGESRALWNWLLPASWRPTLYVFALSEGYLRDLLKGWIWFPLRRLGEAVLPRRLAILALGVPVALVGLWEARHAAADARFGVAIGLLLLAALFSACGLGLWRRPLRAMAWVSASSLIATASVMAAVDRPGYAVSFYALGIALSCVFGLVGLARAISGRGPLARFSGLAATRPIPASITFLGALGLAGFPLLPTFLGEDLLVHATLGVSRGFSVAIAAGLALNGYLAVRTFAFTFFGRPSDAPAEHPAALPEMRAAASRSA